MLTLPSTWDEALSRPHKATWLFELYYDSTNYVGLSFEDIDYLGTPFYGAVLNKPSIRDAMNLAQSKASTSNLSLSVANFQYNGKPFSEELFGGTNKYINKDCKIYAYLEDSPADTWDSLTANWEDETRDWDAIGTRLQIYQGRITGMSHTADSIEINIVTKRPWDFISIPNTKDTTDVYIPISYGNFTPSTHGTYASPQFPNVKTYRPVPLAPNFEIDGVVGGNKHNYYITGIINETSTAHLYYFDKSSDLFIPVSSFGTNTGLSDVVGSETVYYQISAGSVADRGFKIRPIGASQSYGNSVGTPNNAIDNDGSDPSVTNTLIVDVDNIINSSSAVEKYRVYEFIQPSLDGDFNTAGDHVSFDVWYDLYIDDKTPSNTWIANTIIEYKYTDAAGGSDMSLGWTEIEMLTSGSGSGSLSSLNRQNGSESSSSPSPIVVTGNSGYNLYLRASFASSSGTGYMDGRVVIKDVQIRYNMINDEDKPYDYFYSGIDGWEKSYSGGSGTATEIHEAHRDILKRYVGVDDSDANITGWTALDSARSGWNLRYWLLEPESVKSILEKLQYEGCFIFWFRGDGTMRYYHRPDSPSADFTLTKHDVTDLKVSHTDFSDLVTTMKINYEKHPAENRYISNQTKSNGSARTNWNIQSDENIKEIKLDALVANTAGDYDDDPNDGFFSYYANLNSDVRLMISGKILNPKFAYQSEIGDVIAFSTAPTDKFFGESYSGKKFVITKIQKSVDSASFEAFELKEN